MFPILRNLKNFFRLLLYFQFLALQSKISVAWNRCIGAVPFPAAFKLVLKDWWQPDDADDVLAVDTWAVVSGAHINKGTLERLSSRCPYSQLLATQAVSQFRETVWSLTALWSFTTHTEKINTHLYRYMDTLQLV